MELFGRRTNHSSSSSSSRHIYEKVSIHEKEGDREYEEDATNSKTTSSSSSGGGGGGQRYREERKRRKENVEQVSNKIHAFLWIVADILLLYLTDFWNVCVGDDRVNRTAFNLGVVCLGVFSCLICYAAIWMPYVKHVNMDVQLYAPRLIPTASIFGVLASISFLVGLWPVFGIFTPIILTINFFSLIMTAHFLPAI